MADKTLFLLDGMALAYRAHFGMIRNPRMTSTGINTSMIMVLTNTIMGIIDKAGATHIAAVFDTPEPTHRHKMFKEYKAQRESMPEDIRTALPFVFRLFEAFNIPVIRMPGWEADDVIGTLAKQAEEDGFTTYMVTPDKDYGQLVDENTFMCKPGGSGDNMETMGVKEICEKWGIERVEQVIDILGLMGDASDNIPGVPGVGEKTAQKLIAQYGSVENLLENTGDLKGKQKERLEENKELALLSKKLVVIEREVPVEMSPADLALKDWDEEKLKTLFVELEFSTLGKRLFGDRFSAVPRMAVSTGEEGEMAELKTMKDVVHDYQCVETIGAQTELLKAIRESKSFCFDLETTGLDVKSCDILGIAIALNPHKAYYWPVPEDRLGVLEVLERFRPILEDPEREIVGHHLKFDFSVLRWHGVSVQCRVFDTMLAAYLTVPDLRRTMDYLSQALLNYAPQSISELIGEKGDEQRTLKEVPVEQVVDYAAEDADITLQLAAVLRPKIEEMAQTTVFGDIECPLISVLVEMEHEGVRMDVSQLAALGELLNKEARLAADRITELAGEQVDLNSPKQLGTVLFDKLKLDPKAKRTAKSGQYKTDETVLRRLAERHEIAERIMHYRMCTKLNSVYVSQLPGSVFSQTGRVHTYYDQASIATGRIQSSNPNLQTIPIRTDMGQEIRKAFVPRSDEYLLLAADYSQIELRIAAELSQDEGLMETFLNEEDIHSATAMKIYEVDTEDVTAEMRRRAKTVNFGIIYGISAFGLSERLNITRGQAQELIDQYFSKYPGTVNYMKETVKFAEDNGYVQTLTGRRRYLRDINSANGTTKRGEERNAINSRIQGTAADLIKIAMVRIHREIREKSMKTRMLLQVHDELVFDLHRSEQDTAPAMIEECMRTALPMKVPVVVEMGIGENWLQA
ncbi:MAG: DNA polymerase I, partial [Candidatus Latescibacteria bacterium]|nr:DNA polymerase I [Candidatus Latescibacterota bacterium]